MRWCGVVLVERLHCQRGPLGTHPRMRIGLGLAICGVKQMATLATLWKANIEVCFVHQQLFRRRSGNLFR